MRIIAFDQASRTTGYSVFEDGKLITHGKFTFEDTDFGVRLMKIRNKAISLIHEYVPNEVVIEDIQLQENVETFKKLAEVYGIFDELLCELDIPHQAVLSTSWKSTLNIKGRTRPDQKRNAAIWVENTYGIKPTQDECDAICIGAHFFKNNLSNQGFDWSE